MKFLNILVLIDLSNLLFFSNENHPFSIVKQTIVLEMFYGD